MKKLGLCVGLACAVVLAFSSAGQAGLCLDNDNFCNDYYFDLVKGPGAYALHGYEYGCGIDNKVTQGALRVTGGYAYFCIWRISPGYGDYGMYDFEMKKFA